MTDSKRYYASSTALESFKSDMGTNPLGTRAGIKRLGGRSNNPPVYIVEYYNDSIKGPTVEVFRPRFAGEEHFRNWVHVCSMDHMDRDMSDVYREITVDVIESVNTELLDGY